MTVFGPHFRFAIEIQVTDDKRRIGFDLVIPVVNRIGIDRLGFQAIKK